MRQKDHYIISTIGECNAAIIHAPLNALIILGGYLLVLPSLKGNDQSFGLEFYYISALFLFAFGYYVYVFSRFLWKKRHDEHCVYFDFCREGVVCNLKPNDTNSRSISIPWEDIEYLVFYVDTHCFSLKIKTYKNKPVRIEINYRSWYPPFPGLYKAIRLYSGREDILKEEHLRPFV